MSNNPNYDEIMKRRRELTSGPLYQLPDAAVKAAIDSIRRRTPKSAQLYSRAQECMPGGAEHMLVNKNPYPITVASASGTSIRDVDGNRYLDYFMMAGPIILGHNYKPLIKQIKKVLDREGVGTGWTSEYEIKAIELIKKHFKNVELFRYFQSGTEANMAAARAARVYTGKKKIIKMGGTYQGWGDQFAYEMHIPFSGGFESAGIPEEFFQQLVCVPPNDVDALGKAFEEAEKDGGIAAVFVEPLGGESGATPMDPKYPGTLREMCDRYQSLLVFDEVVTAFRIGMGGAQELYGVDADMTIFGKILTHGFPSSGGVGGKKDIIECFVAGLQPGKGHAFVGGTMGANPLSTAATYYGLSLIEEKGAIEKAAAMGDALRSGLNELFERMGFPFFAYNYKSIVHFETAAPIAVDIREPDGIPNALNRKQAVDNLGVALLAENIITKYGNRAFTCMAHTDKDIQVTLAAFEKILGMMEKAA
jgi:glutamate-1-semialdehyde 2,1-aminomutase